MRYDCAIIGAGPGGIFTAFELVRLKPELKICVLEAGNPLEKRKCPIDGVKIKNCIHCSTCAIMNGFGGAGAFFWGWKCAKELNLKYNSRSNVKFPLNRFAK